MELINIGKGSHDKIILKITLSLGFFQIKLFSTLNVRYVQSEWILLKLDFTWILDVESECYCTQFKTFVE